MLQREHLQRRELAQKAARELLDELADVAEAVSEESPEVALELLQAGEAITEGRVDDAAEILDLVLATTTAA